MNRGFALLALRRMLPPGFALIFAALALLVVRSAWTPEASIATALETAGESPQAASTLGRADAWLALLALLAPFLVARAAGTVSGWRRGEADWMAASAAGRLTCLGSTFAGQAVAALLFVFACAFCAELAAGPAGPGWDLHARFATPGFALELPGQSELRRFESGALPPGSRLRARLAFLGGGPVADVWLEARRSGSARAGSTHARVFGPRVLEVEVPEGSGALEVVLRRGSQAALVALERDGFELVTPTPSARLVGARVALRAWLATLCALALALGFGAWFSAGTAFLAVIATLAPALLLESGLAKLTPWRGLRLALSSAGEGVAAPWPSARAWLAALVLIGAGLALGVGGLRHWRRAP